MPPLPFFGHVITIEVVWFQHRLKETLVRSFFVCLIMITNLYLVNKLRIGGVLPPILHVPLNRVLVKQPVWPLFIVRRHLITAAPGPVSISLPPKLCGTCGGQYMSCTAAPPYRMNVQTIWLTMSVPPYLLRPPTSQPVSHLIQNNSPLSCNRKLKCLQNLKLCQRWLLKLLYPGTRRRVVL